MISCGQLPESPQFLPKFYVMAGNHDRSKWLHHVVMGRVPDTYYYAFQANGVQFACLDSSVKNSTMGSSVKTSSPGWMPWYPFPRINPWAVALHHHPIVLGSQSMESIRLTDGEALHRILLKARHRIRCVLFGHIHESVTIIRDGITYASTHSTWFQSRSWHGQDDFQKDVIHTPGFMWSP